MGGRAGGSGQSPALLFERSHRREAGAPPLKPGTPTTEPLPSVIIGQRDRTAFGRAWAPKTVVESLGNYPVLGRKAAAAMPRAQLVEIADAGHLPQVEAFGQYIDALVRFLLGDRAGRES